MSFENQMNRIVQKADLKKWIDELPDTAKVLLVVEETDTEGVLYESREFFGDVDETKAIWMLERCKLNILTAVDEVVDDGE